MKYSEDTDEHRTANIDYVKERWKQLYGLEMEFSSEGIKYLLLVNSGAAVAVLAFHGAVSAVRDMTWPKVMLGFFVIGVILIGMLHIARYKRINALFRNWRSSVNGYFTDIRGWSDVVNDDVARAEKFAWSEYLAYASFACFIAGASIGMFNFSTLNSGENHVGKEAVTTPATSTKTNGGAASTINRQDTGRGQETLSNAKHSSPTADTNKEVSHSRDNEVNGK